MILTSITSDDGNIKINCPKDLSKSDAFFQQRSVSVKRKQVDYFKIMSPQLTLGVLKQRILDRTVDKVLTSDTIDKMFPQWLALYENNDYSLKETGSFLLNIVGDQKAGNAIFECFKQADNLLTQLLLKNKLGKDESVHFPVDSQLWKNISCCVMVLQYGYELLLTPFSDRRRKQLEEKISDESLGVIVPFESAWMNFCLCQDFFSYQLILAYATQQAGALLSKKSSLIERANSVERMVMSFLNVLQNYRNDPDLFKQCKINCSSLQALFATLSGWLLADDVEADKPEHLVLMFHVVLQLSPIAQSSCFLESAFEYVKDLSQSFKKDMCLIFITFQNSALLYCELLSATQKASVVKQYLEGVKQVSKIVEKYYIEWEIPGGEFENFIQCLDTEIADNVAILTQEDKDLEVLFASDETTSKQGKGKGKGKRNNNNKKRAAHKTKTPVKLADVQSTPAPIKKDDPIKKVHDYDEQLIELMKKYQKQSGFSDLVVYVNQYLKRVSANPVKQFHGWYVLVDYGMQWLDNEFSKLDKLLKFYTGMHEYYQSYAQSKIQLVHFIPYSAAKVMENLLLVKDLCGNCTEYFDAIASVVDLQARFDSTTTVMDSEITSAIRTMRTRLAKLPAHYLRIEQLVKTSEMAVAQRKTALINRNAPSRQGVNPITQLLHQNQKEVADFTQRMRVAVEQCKANKILFPDRS